MAVIRANAVLANSAHATLCRAGTKHTTGIGDFLADLHDSVIDHTKAANRWIKYKKPSTLPMYATHASDWMRRHARSASPTNKDGV